MATLAYNTLTMSDITKLDIRQGDFTKGDGSYTELVISDKHGNRFSITLYSDSEPLGLNITRSPNRI